MEQSRHIERYTTPSNLDIAPFGTIAKVIIDKDKNEFQVYIQLSEDDSKIRWERLGMFFEEVFSEDFVSNSNFIETCLALFKNLKDKKNDKPISM